MSGVADSSVRELQMLEQLSGCACRLAMRFGDAAEAEPDLAKSLEFFDAFNRGFLAVRMGIRLRLALAAAPRPARGGGVERDPSETDRVDREPTDPAEREREREHEPVSLPKFLATLGVVASDASRLGATADLRADSLELQTLLARARPAPAAPRVSLLGSASAVAARPPAPGGLARPRPPPRRSR